MTTPSRPFGLAGIVATFGDPRPFVNEKETWEQHVLLSQPLPLPLIYAYDPAQVVRRVRAHRLIVEQLVATLTDCLTAGVPLARLKYGGSYMWRAKRTSSELSVHTWGVAVDLEPAENPLGEPWVDDGKRLHPKIVETFKARGWFWGGEFQGTKDPQHFQWAAGY